MLESISCLFFSWLLFPFFVSSLYFPPWFVSFFFLYFPFFNYIDQIIYSHVMIWTLEMFAHWLSFIMKRWHLLLFFFLMEPQFFLPLLLTSAWYLNWWQLIHDIFQTRHCFVQWIAWNLYIIYCFSSKGWTVFFICHVSCIYNIKSIKKQMYKKKTIPYLLSIYISLVSLYMWTLPHPVCINSLIRCNLYKCHQQSLFNNKEIINVLQKVYELLLFMSFQTTTDFFTHTVYECCDVLMWWFGAWFSIIS